jgi:hypothetical protein
LWVYLASSDWQRVKHDPCQRYGWTTSRGQMVLPRIETTEVAVGHNFTTTAKIAGTNVRDFTKPLAK